MASTPPVNVVRAEEQAFLDDPQVGPLLSSSVFSRASTLRRLLVYLWANRAVGVTEYCIAVDALGRRPDFDPREDATVRVQVARLRQRLADYYDGAGQGLPERLHIPLGSYQLQVVAAPTHPAEVESAPAPVEIPAAPTVPVAPAIQTVPSPVNRWLAGLCIFLSIVCAGLGYLVYLGDRADHASRVPRFWVDFLGRDSGVRVIVPTPVFFKWPNTTFSTRDYMINDVGQLEQSAPLRHLQERYGRPGVTQVYTVASDTFAAARLTQYLQGVGVSAVLSSNVDTPATAMERETVVLVGSRLTLSAYQDLWSRLNFQMASDSNQRVANRSPRPGEPASYVGVDLDGSPKRLPAVLALLPGASQRNRILILISSYSSGLVELLTSENGLRQFDAIWSANGKPAYWEAVVQVEAQGNAVLSAKPLALRPVPATPSK